MGIFPDASTFSMHALFRSVSILSTEGVVIACYTTENQWIFTATAFCSRFFQKTLKGSSKIEDEHSLQESGHGPVICYGYLSGGVAVTTLKFSMASSFYLVGFAASCIFL